MKQKRAPLQESHPEPVTQYIVQGPPSPDDYSNDRRWITSGCLFAILAFPLALLWDISSPNSGGRAIAVAKGFLIVFVIYLGLQLGLGIYGGGGAIPFIDAFVDGFFAGLAG